MDPALGLSDKQIDHQSYKRQCQKHHKGGGIVPGTLQELGGQGGDEGASHNITGHKRHIVGIVLHTVERGGEGRRNSGAGTVGQSRQAETSDSKMQRAHRHSQ